MARKLPLHHFSGDNSEAVNGFTEVYRIVVKVNGNGVRPLDHANALINDTKYGICIVSGQWILQLPTSNTNPWDEAASG